MEDKNTQEQKLYIPLNVTNRIDYFPGFGKKELMQAVIGLIVEIPAGILIYIIMHQTLPMLITFFAGAFFRVTMTTKNQNNISVVDLISFSINYYKEQRIYPYRPKDEY
ncbi:MAG: hypothetical protein Q4F88_05940 [Eubacteriales bacterium]|nr:hypothetical protein [Eubacteriales bacterium]